MKNNFTLVATVLVKSIFFTLPFAALAQNCSLDLTFGTNGFAVTPIGFADESAHSVAIQPDGKIVVTGYSENSPFGDFALVRYNSDGNLDSTFDTDGKVTTPVGTYGGGASSVVIQTDGKIVVAGASSNGFYNDFTLLRYNSNGSLDTTFDSDGIVITDVGTHNDDARSLAIQSDGKIVAAGTSYNGADSYFAVVRYNTNGSLDTTFDTDGIDTTNFGTMFSWGYAVAIQNDGKIVVVGLTGEILGFHIALIRYNTDGSLDNSFDNDGKVTTTTAAGIDYDAAYDVAIQPDGKIVVAGISEQNADDDFAVVRYNSNGSLDTTFDTDGIVITPFGPFADTPNSVVIQSDGKILAAGYSIVGGTNYYFALARYNSNGSLDTTFDTDGKVTTLFGSDSDTGYDVALQSDGKIVMVGSSLNASMNSDFAVVRYNNTINTGINTIDNQTSEIKIYPNPFANSTTISFSIPQTQKVSFKIVDVSGRLVSTLSDKIYEAGENKLVWNAEELNAGVYFLQIQTAENLQTKKLIVTK